MAYLNSITYPVIGKYDIPSVEIVSDAWKSTQTYAVGDYCIYHNALWRCKVQHSNHPPVEGTYWTATSVADELGTFEAIPITYVSNIYCTETDLNRCKLFKISRHLAVLDFNLLMLESPAVGTGFQTIASFGSSLGTFAVSSYQQTVSPQNGSNKTITFNVTQTNLQIHAPNGIDAVFYRAQMPILLA